MIRTLKSILSITGIFRLQPVQVSNTHRFTRLRTGKRFRLYSLLILAALFSKNPAVAQNMPVGFFETPVASPIDVSDTTSIDAPLFHEVRKEKSAPANVVFPVQKKSVGNGKRPAQAVKKKTANNNVRRPFASGSTLPEVRIVYKRTAR